jgi:hypothetical protein
MGTGRPRLSVCRLLLSPSGLVNLILRTVLGVHLVERTICLSGLQRDGVVGRRAHRSIWLLRFDGGFV